MLVSQSRLYSCLMVYILLVIPTLFLMRIGSIVESKYLLKNVSVDAVVIVDKSMGLVLKIDV